MVHCGFEPSAALGINAGLADNFKMLAWTLRSQAGPGLDVLRDVCGSTVTLHA